MSATYCFPRSLQSSSAEANDQKRRDPASTVKRIHPGSQYIKGHLDRYGHQQQRPQYGYFLYTSVTAPMPLLAYMQEYSNRSIHNGRESTDEHRNDQGTFAPPPPPLPLAESSSAVGDNTLMFTIPVTVTLCDPRDRDFMLSPWPWLYVLWWADSDLFFLDYSL